MATKIAAFIIMALFYDAYLGKKYSQRRQGISTNQIGKGDKPRKVLLIENIMGWATALVIPVEIASIFLHPGLTLSPALKCCPPLQWAGLVVAATGVAFFITAMLTMAAIIRSGYTYDGNYDIPKCLFVHFREHSVSIEYFGA